MIPLRSWLCKCAYYVLYCVKRFSASMFGLCASDALQHLHLKNIYPLFALHSLAFLKLPVQISLTICENPLPQINYIENIPSTSEWKHVHLNGLFAKCWRCTYLQNPINPLISSFLASIPVSKLNCLNLLIALLLIYFNLRSFIAANPSPVEAKFAQNNTVVEEEAGAVVVPVIRNGNIFLASVLQ